LAQLLDRLSQNPRLLALALGALAACGFQPLALWPLALLALALLIELVARAPHAAPGRADRLAVRPWPLHAGAPTGLPRPSPIRRQCRPGWGGWRCWALPPFLQSIPPWQRWPHGWRVAALMARWCWPWRAPGSSANGCAAGCSPALPGTRWRRSRLAGSTIRALRGLLRGWGTYALSGLVVLLAGAWLIAAKRGLADWRGAALVLVPAMLFLSPLRPPASPPSPGATMITLVQPNIDQTVLNDPAMFEANFGKLASLSAPRQPGQRRLLLWPESGVPDYLREGYPERYYLGNYGADPVLARRRLGSVAGAGGMLLSGTSRPRDRARRGPSPRRAIRSPRSTRRGAILAAMPRRISCLTANICRCAPWLEPLGLRGWCRIARLLAGPGAAHVDLGPWGRAGVQICYEIVFSGQVVDPRRTVPTTSSTLQRWLVRRLGAAAAPRPGAAARDRGRPAGAARHDHRDQRGDRRRRRARQFVPRHRPGGSTAWSRPRRPPTLFARSWATRFRLGWPAFLCCRWLPAARQRLEKAST
jgi:apolipoprotein N-acyltransferase